MKEEFNINMKNVMNDISIGIHHEEKLCGPALIGNIKETILFLFMGFFFVYYYGL